MTSQRQRLGGPRQAPGMFSVADRNLSRVFRRPSHRSGFAQSSRQFDEIRVGVTAACGVAEARRKIEQRQTALIRGSPAPPVHLFLKPPPDVAPIPEILREAPQQLQRASAQSADFRRGRIQKGLRCAARFLGQQQQELSPAARSQQDLRQAELGQQSARQHFAQQADPMRAPQKHLVLLFGSRVLRRRREQELSRTQEFAFEKYLNRHSKRETIRVSRLRPRLIRYDSAIWREFRITRSIRSLSRGGRPEP